MFLIKIKRVVWSCDTYFVSPWNEFPCKRPVTLSYLFDFSL